MKKPNKEQLIAWIVFVACIAGIVLCVCLIAGCESARIQWREWRERPGEYVISEVQQQAVRKSHALGDRVDTALADSPATIPDELLTDIAGFYRNGSPDQMVTQLYCREWVLALYRDMLRADISSETRLELTEQLGIWAETAAVDLTPAQCERLKRMLEGIQ